MTDPRTPTSDPVAAVTEAGRRAEYELCHFETCAGMRGPNDCDCGVARAILAIEAEARQQARAAFAAQVAALPDVAIDRGLTGSAVAVSRAEVLALLAAPPEPASPEAPGSGLREAAHRMGPPRWEPGNAQDEWTNRCVACGECWPCAARPDASPGSGLDAETDCDHPKVGPMAPDFPGEWACYRCGQRFMPQNAARPDGAEADAS